jgi:hypothetical protein
MKLRNGFVSNSSSSSFILTHEDGINDQVIDLIQMMDGVEGITVKKIETLNQLDELMKGIFGDYKDEWEHYGSYEKLQDIIRRNNHFMFLKMDHCVFFTLTDYKGWKVQSLGEI